MRHFVFAFFLFLSVLSLCAEDVPPQLLWHRTPTGGNLNVDWLKQTFVITWKGPGPAPYGYAPDFGWSDFKNNVWTYVRAAGRPQQGSSTYGLSFYALYQNMIVPYKKAAETRGGGGVRVWTFVTVPSGGGQGAPVKTVEEVFYINIYPLGTDLDEVEPLPNQQVKFLAEIINQGTETVEMRLLVDGNVYQDGLQMEPGVLHQLSFEKNDMLPGQEGTYEWQKKDADGNWVTSQAGNYIADSRDAPVVRIPDQFTVNNNRPPGSLPTPSPTPPPDPLPELPDPKPNPSPTPTPTPKPDKPIPIRGGVGPNGEMTEENIYEAVKTALENFGDHTATGDLPKLDGIEDDIKSVKDKVEELPGKFEEFGESIGGMGSFVKDFVDGLKSRLGSVPTSVGRMDSISFGKLGVPRIFETPNIIINFNDWYAPQIRAICLWVLTLAFFVKIVKSLNHH